MLAVFLEATGPLEWSACENHKLTRIASDRTVFVSQASEAFSREFLEADPAIWAAALTDLTVRTWNLDPADIIERYGDEQIMVNSAGDWGPSNPLAVPDFIQEMRKRGHSETKIKKIVYDNPIQFFSQSKNFQFKSPDLTYGTGKP